MTRPTREAWVVAGVALVALALRLQGIGAGLPEVYEEAYPFKLAWRMWGWGPDRALDLNPHWFRYPGLAIDLQFLGQGLLYLVLRAAGAVQSTFDFRVLHEIDKTPFYLMGRSITAVLGAATVFPVHFLARRIAGPAAGIAAAALVAVNPPLVAGSRVIEVDVPLILFVASGLLAALRLGEGLTLRRALAAGIATGLATTAKYPGLVLFVPCAVAIACGARRPAVDGAEGRRVAWPRAVGALVIAWLVTVFATSPFLVLDLRSAIADLAAEREHMRFGHFGTGAGSAWAGHLRAWFGSVAGPTLGLASVAGLVASFAGRQPSPMILASFVLAYAASIAWISVRADRYLLPLLPAAIVLGCALAARICARLAGSAPTRGSGRGAVALTVATAVLAAPALAGLAGQRAALRPDTRTLARAWIEAHVPEGAMIATESYGPPLKGPLDLDAVDPDLRPEVRRRGNPWKLYAMVPVPFFQVGPERSARFYDPALHRVADLFIVTGAVRDRYRREPERFAAQLAFYDTLAASWERWREFPSRGGPGSDITIYRQPAHARVFAARTPAPDAPPMPGDGAPSGGEARYCFALGMGYEHFGFADGALAIYVEALRFAAVDPVWATVCAERAAGVLQRMGRADDAAGLLEQAASRAPRAADAARLRALRSRIPAGGR